MKSVKKNMKDPNKPTLYTYCIPYDNGAAPNPFWGICTLVICKPVIRRVAQEGDWVVGIGSKNSPIRDISNHVVYAMKITDKMTIQKYDKFCKENYPNKIPDWDSNDFHRRVGDCIYDYTNSSDPQIRKSVHNETNKETDLKGEYALISNHFYYFGDNPLELPDYLKPIVKQGRGHKSKSNDPYLEDFISWINNQGYKVNSINGNPQMKNKIMKDPDYVSECSRENRDESEEDLKIGLKCK